ncbi:fp [Leucania separata nucleopolyhedrovirus]|uniref:Fp n=1 Tax=Leucania separata nucleopolyhedrovirus TaxID=1307956 RepID=Q0IL43_NPVLS|nr:fp [Leucania separata nucleopolyhedrovirus]AAR28840.1 fp [Leucania separata nucleopolyhedrovirus]
MENDLINVPILKSLIRTDIDRNVSDNISILRSKLKKLEHEQLSDSVEIYGIYDRKIYNKKTRNMYVKKICHLLDLDYRNVVDTEYEKNHIVVRLSDAATAKNWQNRSREIRLKNSDLDIEFEGSVKIFLAASPEHKLLLKKTRDALLPYYKYVSLCKKGVMVRKTDKSKIHIVTSESDINDLFNNIYDSKDDVIKLI